MQFLLKTGIISPFFYFILYPLRNNSIIKPGGIINASVSETTDDEACFVFPDTYLCFFDLSVWFKNHLVEPSGFY
jgi:hypothetical protein